MRHTFQVWARLRVSDARAVGMGPIRGMLSVCQTSLLLDLPSPCRSCIQGGQVSVSFRHKRDCSKRKISSLMHPKTTRQELNILSTDAVPRADAEGLQSLQHVPRKPRIPNEPLGLKRVWCGPKCTIVADGPLPNRHNCLLVPDFSADV